VFLVVTLVIFAQLNIGAIWDFAAHVLPRLSIVTNVLDLLSLLLATPKLYSIETRDNVRNLSVRTLRLFNYKFETPPSTINTLQADGNRIEQTEHQASPERPAGVSIADSLCRVEVASRRYGVGASARSRPSCFSSAQSAGGIV
jgi:hypothetical protein